MSFHVINDARRDLNTMVNRVKVGGLSPEGFICLAEQLARRIDEIEVYLEAAGPIDETILFQGRHGIVGVPLDRMRTVGHLAIIDGGRS